MLRRPRRRLADLTRSTIALHLVDGRTVAGILLGDYADVVALTRARVVDGITGEVTPLDGETLVPLDRISYAQAGIRIDDTAADELALELARQGPR